MKISIIIPVYNVAPYVEECIRSVMNQTMTEGVECIIVDDCGTDDSIEIVESVLAKEGYTRAEDGTLTSTLSPLIFRILHHEHNRGLSAARNTGLDCATGEYITFIDSDDYVSSTYLEVLRSFSNRNTIVECDEHILCDGRLKPSRWKYLVYNTIDPSSYAWEYLTCKSNPAAWAKLYPKILFKEVRFREGYNSEDSLLCMDLVRVIERNDFITKQIPKQLYYYRQRENSIMHDENNPYCFSVIHFYEIAICKYSNRPRLSKRLKEKYIHFLIYNVYNMINKTGDANRTYYLKLCKKAKQVLWSDFGNFINCCSHKHMVFIILFPKLFWFIKNKRL